MKHEPENAKIVKIKTILLTEYKDGVAQEPKRYDS